MAYFLGYDLGSSSVKVALLDADTNTILAHASAPDVEMVIHAPQMGWAEQDPHQWWAEVCAATQRLRAHYPFDAQAVRGIGISYQMHGLVLVDAAGAPLRPAIIWCDSRAVEVGAAATEALGVDYCQHHYLNHVGNFTAAKLRWVQQHAPDVLARAWKMLLPGDYLALRLTGEAATTASGLSEGILWDFTARSAAQQLFSMWGLPTTLLADLVPTFGVQGQLTAAAAGALGLCVGTPVTYRAGDQPNNALSLNVLQPGEVAATAGTSGVVYGIADQPRTDPQHRVNVFLHVNDTVSAPRNGVLLCVNGAGSLHAWLRRTVGQFSYEQMNAMAAQVPAGADGLRFFPFGNGAERVLGNRQLGAQLQGLDFARHDARHLFRAAQEGIVFALNYGFGIMASMGVAAKTVRAGRANMFLSPIFREAFVNSTGATLELYDTDGAAGAARGAGVGAGYYASLAEAFSGLHPTGCQVPEPALQDAYGVAYADWAAQLARLLDAA